MRSIYDIAAALELPVDYFFPDQLEDQSLPVEDNLVPDRELNASEMRDALVNRASEGGMAVSGLVTAQILHRRDRPTIQLKGGVTWMRLTATPESHAEFLEVTYAEGASSGENLSHHQGREFGLILEGELIVQLGFDEHILHQGDSIVFDSETPHRLSNQGSQPMRAVWVVWSQT